jgi:hypothetical protein
VPAMAGKCRMEEVGGDEVVEDEAEGVLHERIDRHYVHLWRLLQPSVGGVAAEEARVWGLRLRPLLLPHAMWSASLWPWRWRPPHLLLAIEREGDISHSVCVILLNATRYK